MIMKETCNPRRYCRIANPHQLSLPGSGEASMAAAGSVTPLVPHNSCSQHGLFFFFSVPVVDAHVS